MKVSSRELPSSLWSRRKKGEGKRLLESFTRPVLPATRPCLFKIFLEITGKVGGYEHGCCCYTLIDGGFETGPVQDPIRLGQFEIQWRCCGK